MNIEKTIYFLQILKLRLNIYVLGSLYFFSVGIKIIQCFQTQLRYILDAFFHLLSMFMIHISCFIIRVPYIPVSSELCIQYTYTTRCYCVIGLPLTIAFFYNLYWSWITLMSTKRKHAHKLQMLLQIYYYIVCFIKYKVLLSYFFFGCIQPLFLAQSVYLESNVHNI